MKNQEQIRQDVINYLNKTSKHTFIKPKATFKWGNSGTPGYYEYDYDNFTYFKVIKNDDNSYTILENDKKTKLNLDYYINTYKGDAKCVISNMLFLNKQMRSVKNTSNVKESINNLMLEMVK